MAEYIELMEREGFLGHHSSSLLSAKLGMYLSGVPSRELIVYHSVYSCPWGEG